MLIMKKFRLQKRYIFLNGFIIFAIITCIVFSIVTGNRYKRQFNAYEGYDSALLSNVSYTLEGDTVEISDMKISGDRCDFTVIGVKRGITVMNLHYDTQNTKNNVERIRFNVLPFNIVYDVERMDFAASELALVFLIMIILLSLGTLIYSFIDYYRKSDFCYSMAICGGISIYLFVVTVIIAVAIFMGFEFDFFTLLVVVVQGGNIFALLIYPFMFILSIYVVISNIVLIKKEGFRFLNLLGVIISLMLLAGMLIIIFVGTSGLNAFSFIVSYLLNVVAVLITYFECMLISVIVCAMMAAKHIPPYDRDYILILGCGIMKNGRLTPLLKSRSVAALDFEKRQFEKTGKHAVFVPSGGQGGDEIISESEAIKRYLIKKDIPQERILMEDQSVNTYQNLLFSKRKMDETDKDGGYKAAFATTAYHIFRGYVLSRKIGMDHIQGIAAKTKWYFHINAFLREFIGLLAQEKWKHLLMILAIMLVILGVRIMAIM